MHVTLVGAGNMGFAMLRAWAKTNEYRLSVVEPNDTLLKRAEGLGARPLIQRASSTTVEEQIDVLIIATKPQTVPEAIALHSPLLSESALIISVAAGVTISSMSSQVPRPVPIIRAMPNTPAGPNAKAWNSTW
jgi:pyrroline-5-carboxylate reductase